MAKRSLYLEKISIEKFLIARLITEITEFLSPPKLSRCTVTEYKLKFGCVISVVISSLWKWIIRGPWVVVGLRGDTSH